MKETIKVDGNWLANHVANVTGTPFVTVVSRHDLDPLLYKKIAVDGVKIPNPYVGHEGYYMQAVQGVGGAFDWGKCVLAWREKRGLPTIDTTGERLWGERLNGVAMHEKDGVFHTYLCLRPLTLPNNDLALKTLWKKYFFGNRELDEATVCEIKASMKPRSVDPSKPPYRNYRIDNVLEVHMEGVVYVI